jgi:transcriptional regulator with XRE-family HTH domain
MSKIDSPSKQPLREALAVAMIGRRTELGIRQDELAARAGLTRQYISMVERQERIPCLDTLLKICEGLQLNAVDFMIKFMTILDVYREIRPVRYTTPESKFLKVADQSNIKRSLRT